MDILFTQNSERRLKERSTLTQDELAQMFSKEAYSMVDETDDYAYFVVWDNSYAKPLLVIMAKQGSNLHIITIVDTYEYSKARNKVLVRPGHITEARARRARFLDDTRIERENQNGRIAKAMLRLEFRITKDVQTYPRTVIRKVKGVFKLSLEEFELEYRSDCMLLMERLAQEGLLDEVELRQDESLFMFLWNKGNEGETVTMFSEQVI